MHAHILFFFLFQEHDGDQEFIVMLGNTLVWQMQARKSTPTAQVIP